MRKILIALVAVAAVALGGCQSFDVFSKLQTVYTDLSSTTVPAEQAQIAISSFQVIEAGATQYFKYCKQSPADAACAPGTVASPGPLRLAIKYDRLGRQYRDQIKAAARSGAPITTVLYNFLTGAIAQLTATPAAQFGVQ